MKRKRRIYVPWYRPRPSYGESGWPTLNTDDNVFVGRSEARKALKDHNKRWPDDAVEMSIKIFEEVSR